MQQRIQKIIAAHGLMSRRKAEMLLEQGRIQVNGASASLGQSADEALDTIVVDGVPLDGAPPLRYIMLYKPRGYITTMSDDQGRKTVLDLVADCPVRVFPVGRLDQFSEGLLLLTNDGALANRLMHPSEQVNKTYLVWVTGYCGESTAMLSREIELDGRKIAKPEVLCLWARGGEAQLRITIHEGRNRQIRRMCEAAGLKITRLKRIQEASLLLGDLPLGKWRDLTPNEVSALKKE